MDYEIYPLAITQPEWSIFIDVCQRVLGISPMRGLDACHLDPKDPAAFLACMNMENKPLATLREGGLGFAHYSITFVMILDLTGFVQLLNTPLTFLQKEGRRRDEYLVIASGTMNDWLQAILLGCKTESKYELRWIMNHVLARFEQAGFREIFSRYSKHNLTDGTFTLKT